MGNRARCRCLRSKSSSGTLERIGDTLTHEIDYGILSWIETKRPGLTHAEKYRIYLKRVHDREKSIGRRLTPSELERFTRAFNASDYHKDLEEISAEQWDELHTELENKRSTDRPEEPL